MVALDARANVSEIEILQTAVPNLTFRSADVVEEYLVGYPQIKYYLVTIWPTLVKFFGRSVKLELEVLTYPDESGKDELVGWIQYRGGDIESGLDKLEAFEAETSGKQNDLVGEAFNFNIDFV